LLKLVVYYSI